MRVSSKYSSQYGRSSSSGVEQKQISTQRAVPSSSTRAFCISRRYSPPATEPLPKVASWMALRSARARPAFNRALTRYRMTCYRATESELVQAFSQFNVRSKRIRQKGNRDLGGRNLPVGHVQFHTVGLQVFAKGFEVFHFETDMIDGPALAPDGGWIPRDSEGKIHTRNVRRIMRASLFYHRSKVFRVPVPECNLVAFAIHVVQMIGDRRPHESRILLDLDSHAIGSNDISVRKSFTALELALNLVSRSPATFDHFGGIVNLQTEVIHHGSLAGAGRDLLSQKNEHARYLHALK